MSQMRFTSVDLPTSVRPTPLHHQPMPASPPLKWQRKPTVFWKKCSFFEWYLNHKLITQHDGRFIDSFILEQNSNGPQKNLLDIWIGLWANSRFCNWGDGTYRFRVFLGEKISRVKERLAEGFNHHDPLIRPAMKAFVFLGGGGNVALSHFTTQQTPGAPWYRKSSGVFPVFQRKTCGVTSTNTTSS